ncbi:hypothetical protein ACFL1X_07780, partial [Candidatus Hydrogenedentota bacterium]
DWSEDLFLGEESLMEDAWSDTGVTGDSSGKYPGFSWEIGFEELEDERVYRADLVITGPSKREYSLTWFMPFLDEEFVEEEEDEYESGAGGR